MRSRYALVCVGSFSVIVACASPTPPSATGESASRVTTSAPIASDIVVYKNPNGDLGLPDLVPVVLSYSGQKLSAAFRVECGANNGQIFEAFGYPGDLDLNGLNRHESLDALRSYLAATFEGAADVPFVPLRCSTDPVASARQIVTVYRTIDADKEKGQSDYYVRLNEDPTAIYSLGCWNFVQSLGWAAGATPPTVASVARPPRVCDWGCAWEDEKTVPINQAVLVTWQDQGIVRREIHCSEAHARPLPPVDPSLVDLPAPPASDRAQLFKVAYPFDGISAPVVLYLISNGKGYAIDCGANQEAIKAALAFPADAVVPTLSASDPVFIASNPGGQPNLRCANPGATIYGTLETDPRTDYFRFAKSSSLFRFTCEETRAFFAGGITDIQRVPEASVPYLFVDPNRPEAPTDVLPVGCGAHDECKERAAACAAGTYCVDAYVGYRCAACDAGYTSDGYTCRDIDECATKTASCAAGTYCVNDPATYHCEACATGFTSEEPSELADVNGDGLADFVGFGRDGVVVALAGGGTFDAPRIWVKSYGEAAGNWTNDRYPRTTADVNGDGLADIVGFGNAGVYVSLSTGTSFRNPELWVAAYGPGSGGWQVEKHPRFVTDVNADGRADVVGFSDGGVYVSLSTGAGFRAPSLWVANYGINVGGWESDKHPRTMADVDGDGMADVVGFGTAGVYVSRSTGSAFTAPALWVGAYGVSAGGWQVDKHPRMMGDVDGDGKADVVGFADTGVYVSLARRGSFTAPTLWLGDFGAVAGHWQVGVHPRALADVDGDGKVDVVGFGNLGAFVALAQGGRFSAATLWAHAYGASAEGGAWTVAQNPRLLGDIDGDHKADVVGLATSGILSSRSTGSAFTAPSPSFDRYMYAACNAR